MEFANVVLYAEAWIVNALRARVTLGMTLAEAAYDSILSWAALDEAAGKVKQ